MNKSMSILTALTVILGAGFYVSRDAPAVALELSWSAPVVEGCFVAADGYIVQIETDGAVVDQDTVMTNGITFLPTPGTHRFRVVGFSIEGDGSFKLGEVVDQNCEPSGDLAWSVWSEPIETVGTVGVATNLNAAAGVK